jgi:5-methylcytosine-specific restriction enzyme subunit McrC
MIKISNIYYMLAYAFRSLNAGEISLLGNEEFENLHELFAHIIITNVQKQIKRGLPRRYVMQSEELSNLRDKIDIQSSIRTMTMIRRRLVCEYDESTEDTPGNRLIKCAIAYLIRQKDVSSERKHNLSFLYSRLSAIADARYIRAPQQRVAGAE